MAMRYAILLFILSQVACQFVADLFLSLKYSNPKNRLENDFPCDLWVSDLKCDVYFEICVSSNGNSECDLLQKTTAVFLERTSVQMTRDRRIVIPLRLPLPRSLRIHVIAWDHDAISANDLIGEFSLEGKLQYFLQEERNLRPRKRCSSSISMELELKCRENWFGKLCETYCNPFNNSFTCDENGNVICFPGYFGPSCTRKDYCYLEPCVENAQCENTDVGYKCICDGRDDAKCYAKYRPCANETCSANGVCKPSPESADGFECECKRHWRGKRCEIRLDACELEEKRLQELEAGATAVCLNNGTCVSDPNGHDFHCQCSPDWQGSRCEEGTHQRLAIGISSSVSTSIVLMMVVVVAIVVGKKVTARKRFFRHGFMHTANGGPRTMTMPIGENSMNSDRRSIHIYADIGDPYVIPTNFDLTTAERLTKSFPPEQSSDSESPPVLPPRTARQETQPNEPISFVLQNQKSCQC